MILNKGRPSFEKVHYMLRLRKQIERKIIIELLQELQTKLGLNIPAYHYVGMGSIYYYDFILFHKFLNIRKMISLDDQPYPKRFEFNRPFDFVGFHNITTTQYLDTLQEIPDPLLIWFDYDSQLISFERKHTDYKMKRNNCIFEDISTITKKSKKGDIFMVSVSLDAPSNFFYIKQLQEEFVAKFDPYLTGKYKNPVLKDFKDYSFTIQNMLINIFRNKEAYKDDKFVKLFSFFYRDTTPMYTLGGIFTNQNLSSVDFGNDFLDLSEDNITNIDVPLLTYREKLGLDRKIDYFAKQTSDWFVDETAKDEIIGQLDFECDCIDLQSYLKFYRYYPQYYEGII